MKKIFTILLVLSIFIIAVGCGRQNTETLATGTDYTVKVENTFSASNISDDNLIASETIAEGDWPGYFRDVSPERMYKEAEFVAYGTVGKVEFYDSIFHGLTIYDFTFEKVYKGDFKEGDSVTVGTSEGDVRMSTYLKKYGEDSFDLTEEQIANTVIRYRTFGEEIPKEGEKFLIFFSKYIPNSDAKEGEDWPGGIYEQFKVCAGRYFYNEKGEMERAIPTVYQTIYVPKDEKGNILPEAKDNKDKWTFEELDKKLSELKAK
jgi:hypothetical protein